MHLPDYLVLMNMKHCSVLYCFTCIIKIRRRDVWTTFVNSSETRVNFFYRWIFITFHTQEDGICKNFVNLFDVTTSLAITVHTFGNLKFQHCAVKKLLNTRENEHNVLQFDMRPFPIGRLRLHVGRKLVFKQQQAKLPCGGAEHSLRKQRRDVHESRHFLPLQYSYSPYKRWWPAGKAAKSFLLV